MPGTSGTPTTPTDTVLTSYINELQDDFARSYCPIEDYASYAWPAGAFLAKWSLWTCSIVSGNVPFAALSMSYAGTQMNYASRGAISNWDPTQLACPTTGYPLYYYDFLEGVRLSAPPPSIATVAGSVLVTPQALVSSTDTPQFPADLHYALSVGVCAKLLLQRRDSPELQARGKDFDTEYLRIGSDCLGRVFRSDTDIANVLRYSAVTTPNTGDREQHTS
jgi:hypothetical protein